MSESLLFNLSVFVLEFSKTVSVTFHCKVFIGECDVFSCHIRKPLFCKDRVDNKERTDDVCCDKIVSSETFPLAFSVETCTTCYIKEFFVAALCGVCHTKLTLETHHFVAVVCAECHCVETLEHLSFNSKVKKTEAFNFSVAVNDVFAQYIACC